LDEKHSIKKKTKEGDVLMPKIERIWVSTDFNRKVKDYKKTFGVRRNNQVVKFINELLPDAKEVEKALRKVKNK
jgi:hypothetical protein